MEWPIIDVLEVTNFMITDVAAKKENENEF